MTSTLPICIGYDEREHVPYLVARHSALLLTKDANVVPLNHRELRALNLFDRPWIVSETGQYIDSRDGRPFSVQFSHSRFLTPFFAKELGYTHKYAIFFDCDFVVKRDLRELINEIEASGGDQAVYVVKHDYNPTHTQKMDGMAQQAYNRKLWSAMMVFNLEHPDVQKLTPEVVNKNPGSYFHQFQWTNDIGSVSERWQFIPGHSDTRVDDRTIGMIHWTEGGPWFHHKLNCDYAPAWLDAYQHFVNNGFDKEELLFAGLSSFTEIKHKRD